MYTMYYVHVHMYMYMQLQWQQLFWYNYYSHYKIVSQAMADAYLHTYEHEQSKNIISPSYSEHLAVIV